MGQTYLEFSESQDWWTAMCLVTSQSIFRKDAIRLFNQYAFLPPSFLPLSLPFPPIRFEKISYHPLLSVSINIFLFTACSETSPLFSILYLGLFPYLLKEVLSSIDIVRFQEIGVIPITLKITAPSLSEGNQARSSSLWRMCGFGQRLVVMQTRCSSGKGGPGTWERVGESPWGCLAGETGPGWKEAQKWDGHGLHRKIDEPR